MNKLNLPEANLKIINKNNTLQVFDIIRKKYIVLTPEEYVRQQFVHFLINEKKYPKGLLVLEKQLKVFNTIKRADIVLYDTQGKPVVIVECKAPEVKITQKTFDQIARYNMNFKALFLIVSNGLKHYCCKPDYTNNSYNFLSEIPSYETIKNEE